MSVKKSPKIGRKKAVFAGFLVLISMLLGVISPLFTGREAFAVPEDNTSVTSEENSETSENDSEETNSEEGAEANEESSTSEETEDKKKQKGTQKSGDNCKKSLGALGWVVCPVTGKVSEAVDWLYDKIESVLVVNPVPAEDGTPIYEIWKYCRGLTNFVFIIFLLVVIYSQLTGVGITNYGVKKVLPKLIITAIMVNLSFLICSIAVDVSNIVGSSLRGTFESVEQMALENSSVSMEGLNVSYSEIYSALASGSVLAIGAGALVLEQGVIWMMIPIVLGAIVAVASGLITIAMRQAVVALLIMISPLAMVANLLPNTEKWFTKWKDLLTKMLVFYPMFSLLFGASSLAGFAIIMAAKDGFGLLLGTAVQIFPLFFSWSLMRMSGTFLSNVNAKLNGLANKPLATNRGWAESHRIASKQKHLAAKNAYTPSLALAQFLSNRKIAREEEANEYAATVKNRGLAYSVARKYRNGVPTKEGEEDYEAQARNMKYASIVERHKNNMNKGLGQLEAVKTGASAAQKARLGALDSANVRAADTLFAEKTRGEKIEYENAMGRHKRFEEAINAHMDDVNGFERNEQGEFKHDETGKRVAKAKYKFHLDPDNLEQTEGFARYNTLHQIMEGNVSDVQYVAAAAAQGYDSQRKIYETKMQKYFDLAPPSQDVMHRLTELTTHQDAALNIDSIVPGLRILNQRGDTDLVKGQIDNILDQAKGGGIEVGTHASQALASFLMFEVKDSDPMLRRFGKYINLETARAYSMGERQEPYVTYDEYVKGYHIEPDGTKMYAKKDLRKLLEGTSLDNIERTALDNLDNSLKKAYGYDEKNKDGKWDIEGYLSRRREIQDAFEPAFLSSSMKWLSGSEQINSAVKFWTGYELKQKKDKNGNLVMKGEKDNEKPVFELVPVWEGKEFAGHEDEVKEYFRDRTNAFFKDQTTGQILNMRTDYRDATMEHLLESYLNDSSEDESSEERKRKYNEARAEIQTRYGDVDEPEKAQEMRDADLKKLKMELAGKQLRKILGNSGKLKQIYRTRSSGTAINAKDWLRKWVNLDDEKALRKEVDYYEQKRAEQKASEQDGDLSESVHKIYTDDDKDLYLNEISDLRNRIRNEDSEAFFEDMREKIEEWFGENSTLEKMYEDYYKVDNPDADNNELYEKLKELLSDLKNYPDS